jgi:ADP-ribose diphosphatase
MNRLPLIHSTHGVQCGQYLLEEVRLEFSNGERRTYERLSNQSPASVLIVPVRDDGTVLLIREYAVGTHAYELALPKGRLDPGETVMEAANRELKEEVGMGSRRLSYMRSLTLAPTYMSNSIHVVLAEDLYPERLPGDEPEPIDVVQWPLAKLDELMLREDCTEARSMAALFIAREILLKRYNACDREKENGNEFHAR